MNMSISIQDCSKVQVDAALTHENIFITVGDTDKVQVAVQDAGQQTALAVNDNGDIVEIEIEQIADQTDVIVGDLTDVVVLVDEINSNTRPENDAEVHVGSAGMTLGTNTLLLPVQFTAKRVRLYRNGILMAQGSYTRTGLTVTLATPNDVWLDNEYVSIQQY